jgi:hypothetical protein
MNSGNEIGELAAWGLDEIRDRDDAIAADSLTGLQSRAEECIHRAPAWEPGCALIQDVPEHLPALLSRHAEREDMRAEFEGLDWRVGVVDLRRLVSFQRRLTLPDQDAAVNSAVLDWRSLLDIAFPAGRKSEFTHSVHAAGVTVSSMNPDLTIRVEPRTDTAAPFGIEMHHGSPFLEVGSYRERWFLRDGYHRAYRLLRSNVCEIPAVIVHARSLEELGIRQPWFFPEEILFCWRPPTVTDFLSEHLVLRWHRPARRKVVQITITEHFEPMSYDQERN